MKKITNLEVGSIIYFLMHAYFIGITFNSIITILKQDSYLGIILGSIMYSLPVAFLMFYDILKYEDALPYDMAEILGVNKFCQFKDITLPYLYKPLISIIFAIFTLIVTDYGVPLTIGGHVKTLPVMMYEDVIGLLDFVKGSVIGTFLLLPAVVAFIIDSSGNFNNEFAIMNLKSRLGKGFIPRFSSLSCTCSSIIRERKHLNLEISTAIG